MVGSPVRSVEGEGKRLKVAVVGASGYTGGETLRLLAYHPGVEVAHVTADTHAGRPVAAIFPSLRGIFDLVCEPLDPGAVARAADAAFLCLPHKTSMEVGAALHRLGTRVIDLSADFRLKDPAAYREWYGLDHAAPHLLREAVYGLPEVHGAAVAAARLVAVPGCFPTGAILGLGPLLARGLVALEGIVIDSISGASGAGRKPELGLHFSELNENARAYNVVRHRHTPEIEQELAGLAGHPVQVAFTPHLAPLTRGILTTAHVRLTARATAADLLAAAREYYRAAPFVRVLAEGELPETKQVAGANFCDIGIAVPACGDRAVVVTAIDNLVKGASGQAIQCLNLMAGWDQGMGLRFPALYP
jgi:N-acetyl-gamma-glutamyl-phosphate reductase